MTNKLLAYPLIAIILMLHAAPALATVEYAGQTGRACGVCHVAALGGGELTPEGEGFLTDLKLQGHYRPLGEGQRIVRFIVGYIHTMTAIIWFGTILYVHVILKPAYAAKGLPKGELMLGWASIIIMAVTGTLLTIARVPKWEMLWTTRFGVLLSIKIALFMVMAGTAFLVTFIIGPRLRRKRALAALQSSAPALGGSGEVTREELSGYDGQEGRPAYIAYQGKVYDVGKSKLWKGGVHFKRHAAGNDLTEALKGAPHGPDKLGQLAEVGRLFDSASTDTRPPHVKVFYFMAYMNLALVFLIVLVISLWRWW